MMRGDDKLPFLRTAWSAEEMTRIFNERVLPQLQPTQCVSAVRRERMKYRPGKECVMLYALSPDSGVVSPDAAFPPWAVVSLSADGRFEAVYRRHYHTPGDGHPVSAVFLPAEEALVEFFPRDWKLPALAAATDMPCMTPLLARVAPPTASPAEQWICTILRYHPAIRCVIRYALGGSNAPPESCLVGKLYAHASKAARAWSALRSLADSGIYGREWRVPAPLAHVPEMNLVLMGYEPGVPLRELLWAEPNSARAEHHLRSAARMLAALHRLPRPRGERRTVAADGADLAKRAGDIGALAPELSRRIGALLKAIGERLSRLRAERTTLLHGGLTPNQLLADGERLAVIDFDATCHGDPAIDVGTFVSAMHKYGTKMSERQAVERSVELFLREYQAESSDGGVTDRARLIACQELLHGAIRSFLRAAYRWDDLDRAERPSRFIDEAEASLAKL